MKISVLPGLAALLFLISCQEVPPESANTRLREIDTVIEAKLYQEIEITGLNLEATPLTSSDQLALEQGKTSLKLTPIDTGMATLKSWRWQGTDTLVRIRVHIVGDSLTLSLKESLAAGTKAYDFSLDSLQQTLLRYRTVNKPFPEQISLPAVADDNSFSPQLLMGKTSVIDCWFYGCLGCIFVINDLRYTIPKFSEDKKVQFLSFFKDSAYFAEKKEFFETRFYESSDVNAPMPVDAQPTITYNTLNYPSRHFYNLKNFEQHLPVPGYPVLFITDSKGIIRSVFPGGYMGIGDDIERQVRLFRGFVRED